MWRCRARAKLLIRRQASSEQRATPALAQTHMCVLCVQCTRSNGDFNVGCSTQRRRGCSRVLDAVDCACPEQARIMCDSYAHSTAGWLRIYFRSALRGDTKLKRIPPTRTRAPLSRSSHELRRFTALLSALCGLHLMRASAHFIASLWCALCCARALLASSCVLCAGALSTFSIY